MFGGGLSEWAKQPGVMPFNPIVAFLGKITKQAGFLGGRHPHRWASKSIPNPDCISANFVIENHVFNLFKCLMFHQILKISFFMCVASIISHAQDASSKTVKTKPVLLPATAKSADVRAVKWGQKQSAVSKIEKPAPVKQLPKILVYSTEIAGEKCALSYLFLDQKETLTNAAYMIRRQTTQAEVLDAMFAKLDAELTELYGKGTAIYGENKPLTPQAISNLRAGKTSDGRDIVTIDPKEAEELMAARKDPKRKDDPELAKRFMKLLNSMPTIFYAKHVFWENKRTVIRLDMEMSTDGTGWIILLYNSKQFVRKAPASNDRARLFSYSKVDGIKDMVMSQSGSYAGAD